LLAVSDAFGNRVDLLAGLRGLDEEAFTRAVNVPFHSETLRVIGKEDFIAMKVFAGGAQDMEDARRARAISALRQFVSCTNPRHPRVTRLM
jgi:hypothetical protein